MRRLERKLHCARCKLIIQPSHHHHPLPPSAQMVSVQMMSRVFDPAALKAGQVAYREAAGQYKAIRLPYQGQRSAAVFVLPDEGAYKNIFDAAVAIGAVSIMDSGRWSRLPDTLALSVPRFKVSVTQLRLKKV